MKTAPFHVVRLQDSHVRTPFRSGSEALEFKGQGLGAALLADAIERALRSDIAAYALVVDAKDDAALAFYQHHGLIALPNQTQTLFFPLASAKNGSLPRP